MVPGAAQARRHHPDARRATPPGRAKQTHAPCVSSIPIPPSSRLSCRPFPHMQRSPAAPGKKKGTENDRQRTFRVRVTSHPRPRPTLTSYSAHQCLLLPLACSCSFSVSPSPPPTAFPLHTPRLPRAYSQGEQSSYEAECK
ncbi:hypothetical protein B0H13DRAFT_2367562 [Mycena leptocephala]|nr:hypothetical protein B0H13DRAFT_2367562 [Mycena leptocephala]